jgi:hypothetical protein
MVGLTYNLYLTVILIAGRETKQCLHYVLESTDIRYTYVEPALSAGLGNPNQWPLDALDCLGTASTVRERWSQTPSQSFSLDALR